MTDDEAQISKLLVPSPEFDELVVRFERRIIPELEAVAKSMLHHFLSCEAFGAPRRFRRRRSGAMLNHRGK